jgi:hypothetical protein
MKINLIPKFNRNEIRSVIEAKRQRIEKAIILRLQRVGETFVNNARENGSYKDRTGNLRSSIGYVILKNGEQLNQNFSAVSGGPLGEQHASAVIERVKNKFQSGYVLIVVAGMDYAAAVESRGLEVLTGSSIVAEQELKIAFARLSSKIENLQ